jgi:hypothetical protein
MELFHAKTSRITFASFASFCGSNLADLVAALPRCASAPLRLNYAVDRLEKVWLRLRRAKPLREKHATGILNPLLFCPK